MRSAKMEDEPRRERITTFTQDFFSSFFLSFLFTMDGEAFASKKSDLVSFLCVCLVFGPLAPRIKKKKG